MEIIMSLSTLASFVGGISAAIAVKLLSSVDDVLWLSAFLTPSLTKTERTQNAITYASICLLQTGLAFILSQFGSSVVDDLLGGSDDQRMSTDRLLSIISGSALFIYAIILGREYYQENLAEEYKPVSISTNSSSDELDKQPPPTDGEGDVVGQTLELAGDHPTKKSGEYGQSNDSEMPSSKSGERRGGGGAGKGEDFEMGIAPLEIEGKLEMEEVGTDYNTDAADKKPRPLAIIAFLGSLDDLTLFVPMLVGKAFGILQLMIGAMLSAFFIVCLCVCLTQCKTVAGVLEKIPLVAIVATFSVILLVKGIFIMD